MLLAIPAYVTWRYPHVHHFYYIIYLTVVLYVESFPTITHSTQNWSPLTCPPVQQMPEEEEGQLVRVRTEVIFEENTPFEWQDTDSEPLEGVSSILYNDSRVVYTNIRV